MKIALLVFSHMFDKQTCVGREIWPPVVLAATLLFQHQKNTDDVIVMARKEKKRKEKKHYKQVQRVAKNVDKH